MTDDLHPSAAQAASPTYRLASTDQDFIMGPSMRGVRFLLEFAKVDEALRNWSVKSTIVVFGSARIREDGPDPHPRWYGLPASSPLSRPSGAARTCRPRASATT